MRLEKPRRPMCIEFLHSLADSGRIPSRASMALHRGLISSVVSRALVMQSQQSENRCKADKAPRRSLPAVNFIRLSRWSDVYPLFSSSSLPCFIAHTYTRWERKKKERGSSGISERELCSVRVYLAVWRDLSRSSSLFPAGVSRLPSSGRSRKSTSAAPTTRTTRCTEPPT